MNRDIEHIGLSYKKLLEVLVAQNNGSNSCVLNQFCKQSCNRKDIHFSDTFAHRTQSTDPSIGEIITVGGLNYILTLSNTILRKL